MVGEKEEEGPGLRRRRRSRAGRAANKLPEPLVRSLTRMSSSRVVSFDFHNNHRVRRRRRRKGRGTPAGAKVTARSRRGGGRCGTMRWGSHGYKIGINESTACPAARFSISIMNLEAHRPATDEANETLAACGAREGRRRDAVQLASRAGVERSHGESDVRHEAFFGLENNLSSSCHQRSLGSSP